jgi:hypothetical protein
VRGEVSTNISKLLYIAIKKEKEKLKNIENKKIKSRRRRITMVMASRSIAKRLG